MTVDVAYQVVQYAANKNQQGYITPDEFNLIINQGADSFLDYFLGQTQQYVPGRPVPRVGLGNNRTVRQRLSPLIYNYNLNINSAGFSPYPGDFVQVDAMWRTGIYGNRRIRYAEQTKLDSFVHSSIDPIANNPIYLIEDEGFRFHPNISDEGIALNAARLSYVRKPPAIKWGYTLDINGRPVYNPATSVDPIFYDVDMLEVIARALKLIGINLQSPQIEQYAQDVIKGGQ